MITFNQSCGTELEPCITKWVLGNRCCNAFKRLITNTGTAASSTSLTLDFFYFANVDRILGDARARISAATPSPRSVILSLEETFDLDSTTLEALQAFFAWTHANGNRLVLARLKHPVHQLLDRVTRGSAEAPVLCGLSVDDAVQLVLAPT